MSYVYQTPSAILGDFVEAYKTPTLRWKLKRNYHNISLNRYGQIDMAQL